MGTRTEIVALGVVNVIPTDRHSRWGKNSTAGKRGVAVRECHSTLRRTSEIGGGRRRCFGVLRTVRTVDHCDPEDDNGVDQDCRRK